MIPLPPDLATILRETPELKNAYLVGGSVRDALWGHPNKDFDVEVFGCSYEDLIKALNRWGKTDFVGKSFGVAKLRTPQGRQYDFSLPRRDSKVAAGHKGFEIIVDPGISPEEAAGRRDYTINSLLYDPRQDRVLDFYGGLEDLKKRRLRHTSAAFVEDPLRVLRGMQFVSRFGLEADRSTIELARSMQKTYAELPVERIWAEWEKWASRSVIPSRGLFFLRGSEWIRHYPELASLINVPQDPEWHPEGDVFVHTAHCCDAMARLPEWQIADEATRIVLMLGILAHDFGKPGRTRVQIRDGRERIVSPGHESFGVTVAERFLQRISPPLSIRQRIYPLVANHMTHHNTPTDRALRRLAKRLEPETIPNLCTLMTADSMGRPPRPDKVPRRVLQLRAGAERLQLQEGAPKPILLGRHLLERGVSPGKEMGRILERAYEAQLEGEFSSLLGALKWLDDHPT